MSDFAEDTNVPTNDCISRQAAIEAMSSWEWQELYLPVHFKQLLEELPSAEPGWIPVTERLPAKGGWYFVTWEDLFKTVRRVAASEFIEPKGLTDIGHFEGFVLREITAWMPLPEPYEGG